jgi:hypothetical protein
MWHSGTGRNVLLTSTSVSRQAPAQRANIQDLGADRDSVKGRVTIRPGFPGHVLFLGVCPGVRAGFQKSTICPGFWPYSK